MDQRVADRKDELIDDVVGQVHQRLDQRKTAQVERFVRRFCANVPYADLATLAPDQLYGAALSLMQFAQRRAPGTVSLRVYNPRIATSGWQTLRTVVETVNDDMPFLVDSMVAEMTRLGLTVHLVIHPVMRVVRDSAGELIEICEDGESAPEGAIAESIMHFELAPVSDTAKLETIQTQLAAVLADVRHAVQDWRTMRSKVREAMTEADGARATLPLDEVTETEAFLSWIDDDHFTFLGYREYRFGTLTPEGDGEGVGSMMLVDGSGLGILRDDEVTVFDGLRHFASLPPDVKLFLRTPRLLMVTKGNRLSTVHRPVHLDAILVKKFDDNGEIIGERLFAGLFTSAAYNRSPRQIPFLRRKLAEVITRSGFDPRAHDGKALVNILETYPRDELFQIGVDELFEIATGIVHLQERQRLALFVRHDPFERFVSCLIFVPRERYDTALRQRFSGLLQAAFHGTVSAFYTQLAESALARVHFIVKTEPGKVPAVDTGELERRMTAAARSWVDHLRDALVAVHGEEAGAVLFGRYGDAFPLGYREAFSAEQAVYDIDQIEAGVSGSKLGINLYRSLEAAEGELHFKIYHSGRPVALSDVLPVLEHMDLRVITEAPFEVRPAGQDEPVWLHDFTTETQTCGSSDCILVKEKFQDAFAAVWGGAAEDDGFNRLVLRAGLSMREVALLRAMAKYLRQAGLPYAQETIETTLASYPNIARMLVRLFSLWHDPGRGDGWEEIEAATMHDMLRALDEVDSLDQDRIVRRLINLGMAVRRTNYFQPGADGRPKSYISFKIDSQALSDLPLPRPWVEVFVYSPRMEGIHLRGGKVARGGIRWSDRREDFRTEVLGLMKAQMVKNSVIVPVGSKGGFVVKRPPPASAGREAFLAEGIECYKTLIRGLLDITDNLDAEGNVVPPLQVIRLDEDDPYLVVAADKGTATFSDIANGVSLDYGFWLGDGFASGGSAGYDHKKMGITARGAWECVKRHFRELGSDIQTQDFTVVGVGDMSGDVFGNGMLLSKHIKLVAAFDHRHIFLDPDPDPAVSWEERNRLFALPRSSWADYDKTKLSKGGVIFDRAAKSLQLGAEVRERFGIADASMTPQELMQRLLGAQVDLLWFGGIGTYVKASFETNAEVGDKSNDSIRVSATALNCKVVGEGANLGMTQRARIETNARGIRLNTDAIDNSAGVDTSDHEVNIKILLDDVVRRGDMTGKQRNQLLEAMTDEVAQLVLADNYRQSQAITVAEAQGVAALDSHARFMRGLEKAQKLDRAVEFLPDDEELATRIAQRRGLTRPELAVLLGYAKLTLFDALLASDLPDDPFMAADIARYFPSLLRERFPEAIARHRLCREIVATQITNSMVNRVGPTFVREMMEKTGFGPADVARAYAIARDVFGLRDLWEAIEGLDNRAPASAQTALFHETIGLMERAVAWFLAHASHPLDVAAITGEYRPGIESLAADLGRVLDKEESERLAERTAGLVVRGVPEAAAARIAALPVLAAGPDLVLIAGKTGRALDDAAAVYFLLGRRFGLEWLRDCAAEVKADNHWQRQALSAIVDDLFVLQTQLTARVLESQPGVTDGELVEAWAAGHRMAIDRTEALLAELRAQPALELAMLGVANRQLRSLTAV